MKHLEGYADAEVGGDPKPLLCEEANVFRQGLPDSWTTNSAKTAKTAPHGLPRFQEGLRPGGETDSVAPPASAERNWALLAGAQEFVP